MIELLFGPLVLAAAIRLTAPILLVAIGGSFGHKANMLNIGLESFMLSAAFFAMLGSYLTSSAWVGLVFAIISGLLASLIFGLFVLKLKSNPVITGIAFNLAAWGFTTFLLDTLFNVRGVFVDPRIESFKNITLPLKDFAPLLWKVFSGHNILVYLAFLLAFIAYFVMYKTPFGLRLRGVGIKEVAAQTVGIDTYKYKWIAVIISGFIAGIAGAYLSIGGASMFTESMSAGKGFLALAAIMVGEGNPLVVTLICLAFGYTTALSVSLQALGIPSQMVLTFPYLFTILILVVSYIVKHIRIRKKQAA